MTNYSPASGDSAHTLDNVAPGLAISVLQNPYLTGYLDIYVTLSETVIDSSFFIRAGLGVPEPDEDLVPEAVSGTDHVFRCDYTLESSGVLKIEACARDTNSNWGMDAREFGASLIPAMSGGLARSADGRLEIAVPGGTVAEDMYVLVQDAGLSIEGLSAAYEVSPTSHRLDGPVTVSITYDRHGLDPDHLSIARIEAGRVDPLESYIDRGSGRVLAHVDRFGTYGLYWDESILSREYDPEGLRLLQNVPNPFQASTSIAFQVSKSTWLRLDVISVDGRLVTRLREGVTSPGTYGVVWDGTDRRGNRVAAGVYHYVVTTETGTATRKMVLLH
jgi:hypothetical protein